MEQEPMRQGNAGLAAEVIVSTKLDLEFSHRDIVESVEIVERLLAGTLKTGFSVDATRVKELREKLRTWRESRAFFLPGADSPLEHYGSAFPTLSEDAVRLLVRPFMSLPWNGRLLSQACDDFMADRRRGNLRRGRG